MKVSFSRVALAGAIALVGGVMLGSAQPRTPGKEPPARGREGRGLVAELNTFKTDVPSHPYDVILVSPTATSVTVSVMVHEKDGLEARVEYAPAGKGSEQGLTGPATLGTDRVQIRSGEVKNFVLSGLKSDSAYEYRVRTHAKGKTDFEPGDWGTFRTPRAVGGSFTFTVQADSHLDPNVTPEVYLKTLTNALSDRPDFHIDLGDTFMTDKRGPEFKQTYAQYVAQRYYFSRLCASVPLFMALGNHDGEMGYASKGEDSMAAWSFAQRTTMFPAPVIGMTKGEASPFYTGRTTMNAERVGANYYSFVWGDARIIVLDPYWFTTSRPRGGGGREGDVANSDDNWARTLGREQNDWLARTLEGSKSKYTFVFIHHLVGGLGRAARGGAESSVYFEWGGKNADGSAGFAERRAGWAMPIHDLLVKHKVSAVFHGHDHLYVRGERDGLVYQCVPQPGNVAGGTRSAEEYGYKDGTILGSPGYMRVRVVPEGATVEFVRSALLEGEQAAEQPARRGRGGNRQAEANGAVVHSYTIAPRP